MSTAVWPQTQKVRQLCLIRCRLTSEHKREVILPEVAAPDHQFFFINQKLETTFGQIKPTQNYDQDCFNQPTTDPSICFLLLWLSLLLMRDEVIDIKIRRRGSGGQRHTFLLRRSEFKSCWMPIYQNK